MENLSSVIVVCCFQNTKQDVQKEFKEAYKIIEQSPRVAVTQLRTVIESYVKIFRSRKKS